MVVYFLKIQYDVGIPFLSRMICDLGHIKLCKRRRVDDNVRILQLTDIHYFHSKCEIFETKGRKIDVNRERYSNETTPKFVRDMIQRSEPDLVVLTGDVIDGRVFKDMPRDSWRDAFMDIVRPINELNVPWTFTPGNHDDDSSPWERQDLLGVYELEGCISRGAKSFDHRMTVSFDTSNKGIILWFFDSGGNNIKHPELRYETFKCVDAFREQHQRQHKRSTDNKTCELAFFHIPLPQCNGLVPLKGRNGLFDSALNAQMVPFPWNFIPFVVRLLGKDRIVGSSKIESGMYDAMVSHGNIRACFFGHDHFSDAVFVKNVASDRSMYFAYGRVSGFTPPIDWEGDAGTIPFKRGGRVVEVKKNGNVSTWIHNESGHEEKDTRLELPFSQPRKGVFTMTTYSIATSILIAAALSYSYKLLYSSS